MRIAYLRARQEPDGSWFGRWGTNYIYGTWSVLTAFAQAGIGAEDPAVRRAVAWLQGPAERRRRLGRKQRQLLEGCAAGASSARARRTTPRGRCWRCSRPARRNRRPCGAASNHLMRTQQADGLWSDSELHCARLSARVLSKYHGYCRYFPLWALAAYPNPDAGRNRALNAAGVVAALTAEARALGPVAARSRCDGLALADGTLVAVSGIGCAAAGARGTRSDRGRRHARSSAGAWPARLIRRSAAGAVVPARRSARPDGTRFAHRGALARSAWRQRSRPSGRSPAAALLTSVQRRSHRRPPRRRLAASRRGRGRHGERGRGAGGRRSAACRSWRCA